MPDTEQLNQLVDGVFRRFNTLLKKSYDPVTVRLSTLAELNEKRRESLKTTGATKTDGKKDKKKKKKKGVKKGKMTTPKAKASLHGLATLVRTGDASAKLREIDSANITMVKCKFHLGPLRLRVEKVFGRGTKRELRSATATTTQMTGQISLRVSNETAALHSIRVQQPRSVILEGGAKGGIRKGDSNIAHLASSKLRAAARALLSNVPLGRWSFNM